MKTTLLLCFIHGFKVRMSMNMDPSAKARLTESQGGDDTFGGFPEHLRALVSHALPDVDVAVVTYPKFETRGDLRECVGRFRDWWVVRSEVRGSGATMLMSDGRLQNKVIDLEVEAGTPSPTVDPSVRTILVGHSMGGIVAAETVLAIASEDPVADGADREMQSFMFPYIQGVLAFDTPYLGIAPGVVAHGAEGHYNTATSVVTQLSGLAGGLWGGSAAATASKPQAKQAQAALPAPPTPSAEAESATTTTTKDTDATATPAWQRWGKVAMFAGAAGAVAAGGAAAYMKREQLTEGWGWVGSHLEFVGCLMRGEELQRRLQRVLELRERRGLGFADLYTALGAAAKAGAIGKSGLLAQDRTFCVLPKSAARERFVRLVNDQATDEAWAHMNMFYPRENPGYYNMGEKAKELVVEWARAAVPSGGG
ncbi:MAG: hypothetical protein M1832_004233 [Thelocarpon impressellum]|nr:MAG: hypothetical protein M1832_004233 [Thelocarpon impressellum]